MSDPDVEMFVADNDKMRAEIERLYLEVELLRVVANDKDAEIERLRAALREIADMDFDNAPDNASAVIAEAALTYRPNS